jgi:hypothetical protein
MDLMANRRGRPPIADQAALRRVAEHIVAAEEKGTRCSIRVAIMRTSDRVTGNSAEAMLWRLQRKWRRHGPALLAETRKRRAKQRHVASVPMLDGSLGGAVHEFMRIADFQDQVMRAAQAFEEATHPLRLQEVRRSLEELTRPARAQEAMRARLEELTRPARALEEVMRAIRGW